MGQQSLHPKSPATTAPSTAPAAPSHAPSTLTPTLESQLLEALITGVLASTPTSPFPLPTSSGNPQSEIPHPKSTTPLSPISLAHHFHISLPLLLDFIARPSTQARLAAANHLADQALLTRAREARLKAIAKLEALLDSTEDPVELRRAATALLRGPSRLTSTSIDPVDHDDLNDEPALREPPARPKRNTPPVEVVHTVLDRLQHNDNPCQDAGLITLHNHLDPAVNPDARVKPEDFLKSPGDYELLTNPSAALITHTTTHPSDKLAQVPVKLHYPDGDTLSVIFHLRKTDHTYAGDQYTWLIANIQIHREEANDDDEANDSS